MSWEEKILDFEPEFYLDFCLWVIKMLPTRKNIIEFYNEKYCRNSVAQFSFVEDICKI